MQDIHPGGLQDGKDTGKTGYGAFSKQGTYQGQFHHSRIKKIFALIGFQIKIQRTSPNHQNADRDVPIIAEEFIHQHTDLGGQRKFHTGTFKDAYKTGNDGRQQNNKG